jgi:hypothetical protein
MAQPVPNVPPQVVEALKRGDLMGAFKFLRQHYPKMGLVEIKAMVEALQKDAKAKAAAGSGQPGSAKAPHAGMHGGHHHPAQTAATVHIDPRLSPGEEPRTGSGNFFAAVVLAIMFVLGVAFYFPG